MSFSLMRSWRVIFSCLYRRIWVIYRRLSELHLRHFRYIGENRNISATPAPHRQKKANHPASLVVLVQNPLLDPLHLPVQSKLGQVHL